MLSMSNALTQRGRKIVDLHRRIARRAVLPDADAAPSTARGRATDKDFGCGACALGVSRSTKVRNSFTSHTVSEHKPN